MPNLAERRIQPSIFTDFYYRNSVTQTGETIPYPYIKLVLARQWYNIPSYYHQTVNILTPCQPSTKQEESPFERSFSCCIDDAVSRYKVVNHAESYDLVPAKPLLTVLKALMYMNMAALRITFYDDAVKARITYNQREFIIDYDYEELELLYVSTFEGDTLIMKDGPVTELYRLLESF